MCPLQFEIENRRKTMKKRLVNYKFMLCALVLCGLLASPVLTGSETHAFDLKDVGNNAIPGSIETDPDSIPGAAQDQNERQVAPQEQLPGKVPTFPCCECLGRVVQLNISTGQGNGSIDPLWKVNGGSAYITPPFPGWGTLPPAKWIQPVASPTPSPNVPVGNYKYTLTFGIPKCTIPMSGYQLDGKFAADNSVKVSLDNTAIVTCPGPKCFINPGQTLNFNVAIGPGTHTLVFDVKNDGGPSGLLVNALLKGQCKKELSLTQ
jgi:hypothetical protein